MENEQSHKKVAGVIVPVVVGLVIVAAVIVGIVQPFRSRKEDGTEISSPFAETELLELTKDNLDGTWLLEDAENQAFHRLTINTPMGAAESGGMLCRWMLGI